MSAASQNQFDLLRQRRFAPFFWTQFLGAGNDNLLKFAFTVMVTYQLQVSWLPPATAGLVIGALFILPFLLFSATSGQVADKLDKTRLIRFVKWLEVGIMVVAAWGFTTRQPAVLLACVAGMGLHSTLFGPVKFAYLPQHLSTAELTGGNGMVEMGTFVAILLGNLAGGLLIALPQIGGGLTAASCLVVAVLGRLAAQGIPASPATDPSLVINWNPFTETMRNLRLAARHAAVFRSLLGISWMWFFGAVFLSQFPSFAKDVLHGDERVASLLLVVFSIGIGTGSLLCESLGRRQVEIGLVPIGAIGMSVFTVDLAFAAGGLPPSPQLGLTAFLQQGAHWRVLFDLCLLSLSAGLYSVPMYALVQQRTAPTHRARIIAANNILNALFMIVSAIGVGALLAAGLRIPQVFLVVGLLNALVAGYVFLIVPEYVLRFLAFVLTRLVYRLDVRGAEHLPAEGACLLICNHVSYADPVLLMAASPRPITFLMDHRIFAMPVIGWVCRLAGAIPVATEREDPAVYAAAFVRAREALDAGGMVCIFPEGGLTLDGELAAFKGGVMKLLRGGPVPVVPMALRNLWGSVFSRRAWKGWPPIPRRVELHVGAPLSAGRLDLDAMRQRVLELLGPAPATDLAPIR